MIIEYGAFWSRIEGVDFDWAKMRSESWPEDKRFGYDYNITPTDTRTIWPWKIWSSVSMVSMNLHLVKSLLSFFDFVDLDKFDLNVWFSG